MTEPGVGNEVIFNGAVNFTASKIQVSNGTARFRGGLTGATQIALDCFSGADLHVEENPLRMGGGTLLLQDSGTFHFNVAGQELGSVQFQSGARLVCGVDNCLPQVPFYPGQNSRGYLDLAGHSQSLGTYSYVTEWVGSGLTVENSDLTATPTLSVCQTWNVPTSVLSFEGPLNFVKKGAGMTLGISNAFTLKGDLAVEEGTLQLLTPPEWPLKFAESVTLTGGTLDLGGQVWRCGTLRQNGGKIVNGTLYAATNVINAVNWESDATVAGDVLLDAAGLHLLPENLAATGSVAYAHREYELPAGTVLYLPFDSAEHFTTDYSVSDAQMAAGLEEGMPQFVTEGKCDGCAYFDGTNTLVAQQFPARLPTGNAPRTIGLWFRLSEDAPAEASMVCWGVLYTYQASVTAMRGSAVGYFPWGYEGYAGQASGSNLRDGGWHQLVVVWDGTVLRQYVDGFESQQTPGIELKTLADSLVLGATPQRYGATCRFKGWMDEVFVLNRAASAEEVAGFYAQPFVRKDLEINAPRVVVRQGVLEDAPPGAVAIWSFDDADHLFEDATGKGHTLSVQETDGVPVFAADTPMADGGGALYLNGATTLTLSTFPEDMPSGAEPRTVAFFMKSDRETVAEDAMVSLGDPVSPGYAFSCACRGDSVGCGLWGNDDVAWYYAGHVLQSSWHSLVITFDGTKIVYYWDGAAVREYDAPFTVQTSKAFRIGSFGYATSYFKGWLDEVAVYGRALDPVEAQNFHLSGARRRNARLPEGSTVEVASGAVLSLAAVGGVTIESLTGSGSVVANGVTIGTSLETGPSIVGDLTIANGVRILPTQSPTVVSGCLTLPSSGVVTLPEGLPKRFSLPLISATSFLGTETLSGWTFDGATKGRTIALAVRDGSLYLDVSPKGFIFFCP